MELSTAEGKVSLEGVTADYDTLVAQLTIFETVPEIEKVILENSQRSSNVVSFRVTLAVDEELFNFDSKRPDVQPSTEELEPEEL